MADFTPGDLKRNSSVAFVTPAGSGMQISFSLSFTGQLSFFITALITVPLTQGRNTATASLVF